MQNTVKQHINNGKYFFYSHLVTSSIFGNNSANGLVTEILYYFTITRYF
jgi:hypothetical protein